MDSYHPVSDTYNTRIMYVVTNHLGRRKPNRPTNHPSDISVKAPFRGSDKRGRREHPIQFSLGMNREPGHCPNQPWNGANPVLFDSQGCQEQASPCPSENIDET